MTFVWPTNLFGGRGNQSVLLFFALLLLRQFGVLVVDPDVSFLWPMLWSLAAVGVGLTSGFFIGRMFAVQNQSSQLKTDRQRTLDAVDAMMQSAAQLNDDVGSHNSILEVAKQDLEQSNQGDIRYSGIQQSLVDHVTEVMSANKKLENDLVKTRFQLETQAQELDRTRKEARTDPLCAVGNRKAFEESLQYMMCCFTSAQRSFGLILIDVDHFKRVNDSFGHSAGDQVLVSIGKKLKDCVRPNDFVARLGGDEFVILLDEITVENAKRVANRLRNTVDLIDFKVDSGGQTTVVTLSMGMTVVQADDTRETIMERSDLALYRSKELGRNRIQFVNGQVKQSNGQVKQSNGQPPDSDVFDIDPGSAIDQLSPIP